MVRFDRYPGGKHFAVTFSYDDGNVADRRLVALFNKYGLKATFHLISGRLGGDTVVTEEEVPSLYAGHEIAAHTFWHQHLDRVPPSYQLSEILRDREKLERISGKIVRGMSYPYDSKSGETVSLMKSAGIVYGRTTSATHGLALPADFMLWNPSCHHSEALPVIENFKTNWLNQRWNYGGTLYIWGHSFEFDRADNWDLAENICASLSGLDDVWYATNIEIYDYITAIRSISVSADGKKFFNPSAVSVIASSEGAAFTIGAGETVSV